MRSLIPMYKRLLEISTPSQVCVDKLSVKKLLLESYSMASDSEVYAFLWDSLVYLYRSNVIKPLGYGEFIIRDGAQEKLRKS